MAKKKPTPKTKAKPNAKQSKARPATNSKPTKRKLAAKHDEPKAGRTGRRTVGQQTTRRSSGPEKTSRKNDAGATPPVSSLPTVSRTASTAKPNQLARSRKTAVSRRNAKGGTATTDTDGQLVSVGSTTAPNRKPRKATGSSRGTTGRAESTVDNASRPLFSEVTTPQPAASSITNPVPRTGPHSFTSPLEQMMNIKWSQFIPHEPTRKQHAAMMLAHVKELLFGGALGGGKSDWLAYEALRYCDLPGFSAIIFRRQLTDLKQPGSLIPRIGNWLLPHADAGRCKYIGDEHAWIFKTVYPHTDIPGPDARLQFGYIGEASVRERYQSAEYQLVCFDELGQWPEDTDYKFMRSRIRKVVCSVHGKRSDGKPNYVQGCPFCETLSSMPLRIRAATNPGPAWIKRRFGIIPDPSQFPNRHAALVAISEGMKVRWIGTVPSRPFIPSYLDDNPHLDGQDYREMLAEMSDEERSRLEDGNWEARKNARFKRRWQRFYLLYPDQRCYAFSETTREGNEVVSDPYPLDSLLKIFTTVDPAVTVRQGPVDEQVKQKNSYAVISTWGITGQNSLLWLDCRKFRKEIPDLVEQLVEVNNIWQPRFNKIECNGVGIGVAQYAEAAGLPVTKNYRKSDKLENSLSAQMLMKSGRVFFPSNTDWAETVEDDVFSWTGLPSEDDDVVDTLADAATELAPGIAHEISAPTLQRSMPRAVFTGNHVGGSVPHYGLSPQYHPYYGN